MKKNKKKLNFRAGFSLIEVLAVLFVVSISLLGVVSLIIQNIQVQSVNKNNLIASSLAQEGIEFARKKRDSNWRSGLNFDSGLADGSYIIDIYSGQMVPSTNPEDAKLYFGESNYYSHESAPDSSTPFSRLVHIEKLEEYEGEPLEVRSVVFWEGQNRPYSYELRTLLFDWR